MKAVILMAGIGSRLGRSMPKCLSEIPGGETILGRQIRLLKRYADEIVGVVGFKKELIMEAFPHILYVYNPRFTTTNTSKSLLCAFELLEPDDVLWVNGDVVFSEEALEKVALCDENAMAVEYKECGQEEVKVEIDAEGCVKRVSKTVKGVGEAVGVNKVTRHSFEVFREALRKCDVGDYFERAVEMTIEQGHRFKAVDVGLGSCIEVDFPEDLARAWNLFAGENNLGH